MRRSRAASVRKWSCDATRPSRALPANQTNEQIDYTFEESTGLRKRSDCSGSTLSARTLWSAMDPQNLPRGSSLLMVLPNTAVPLRDEFECCMVGARSQQIPLTWWYVHWLRTSCYAELNFVRKWNISRLPPPVIQTGLICPIKRRPFNIWTTQSMTQSNPTRISPLITRTHTPTYLACDHYQFPRYQQFDCGGQLMPGLRQSPFDSSPNVFISTDRAVNLISSKNYDDSGF